MSLLRGFLSFLLLFFVYNCFPPTSGSVWGCKPQYSGSLVMCPASGSFSPHRAGYVLPSCHLGLTVTSSGKSSCFISLTVFSLPVVFFPQFPLIRCPSQGLILEFPSLSCCLCLLPLCVCIGCLVVVVVVVHFLEDFLNLIFFLSFF